MVPNGVTSNNKGKLRRGQLNRRKKGYARSNGEGSGGQEQKEKSCNLILAARVILFACGLASIGYSFRQFHFNFDLDGDPQEAFRRAFSKERLRGSASAVLRLASSLNQTNSSVAGAPTAARLLPPPKRPPPTQPKRYEQPIIQVPPWDLPEDATFNKTAFERRLNSWQFFRKQLYKERYLKLIRRAATQTSRSNSNSTLPIVPYLHHTPMFPKKHLSWDLMVMVMADNMCPLTYADKTGSFNATSRLLNTLEDALTSNLVQVIAYLPHYSRGQTKECHNQLFQSVLSTFPAALKRGQLQIVSTPQLEKTRAAAYRYALDGLDFAYAAELGHQYADLVLFLQAGSRLTPKWWVHYEMTNQTISNDSQVSGGLQAIDITTNRDYALEVMLAYESRRQYDEEGLNHGLCYMNFAKDVGPREYRYWTNLENPTGTLLESAQLLRFALTLRSYSPYGKLPVSKLLHRYCQDLLWKAKFPRGQLLLFDYTPKGNETQVVPKVEQQPVAPSTTYPYLTLTPNEVPSWVKIHPSMIGPQPAGHNPFMRSLDPNAAIPTVAPLQSNATTAKEQYWMTFVIPTAWRHTTSNSSNIKGNTYVVNCIRQLTDIVQNSFKDQYKANILVFISGQDNTDIARHRTGLEIEFGSYIKKGIIRLVDAPLDQYPTLHGLNSNYGDPEHRVRWRSKQNLDISAALFAAKGMGKYVLVVEDDSGFRPAKFFNGIRQQISNFQRQYSPNDAANYGKAVSARSMALRRNHAAQTKNTAPTPGETEFGHREVWSQVRFSFGYSGVLMHDEDLLVFGMMHFILYKEKPCDLLFDMANSVRNGINKDHFLRYNKPHRYITHSGKMSSLQGKVFTDKEMAKG